METPTLFNSAASAVCIYLSINKPTSTPLEEWMDEWVSVYDIVPSSVKSRHFLESAVCIIDLRPVQILSVSWTVKMKIKHGDDNRMILAGIFDMPTQVMVSMTISRGQKKRSPFLQSHWCLPSKFLIKITLEGVSESERGRTYRRTAPVLPVRSRWACRWACTFSHSWCHCCCCPKCCSSMRRRRRRRRIRTWSAAPRIGGTTGCGSWRPDRPSPCCGLWCRCTGSSSSVWVSWNIRRILFNSQTSNERLIESSIQIQPAEKHETKINLQPTRLSIEN